MDSVKSKLIGALIQVLLGLLTPELLKTFADMALDFVEEYVAGTKSTIDDKIVLPICEQIRITFDIPDND
jgi:hypothetical protein